MLVRWTDHQDMTQKMLTLVYIGVKSQTDKQRNLDKYLYLQRDQDQTHLKEGHLALSGLQVRGHAMFSHKDLPLDSETLEYAWLVEAVIGDLSGRLTSPQVGPILNLYCTEFL